MLNAWNKYKWDASKHFFALKMFYRDSSLRDYSNSE